jgi:hypothetical protein
VGYQVIEVAEDVATKAGPQASPHEQKPVPWSPAGYQVVEMTEQKSAGPVKPPSPDPRAAGPAARRKRRRLLRWGAVAAGGSFLLAAAVVLIVIDRLPAGAPAAPPQAVPAPPAQELPGAPLCAATNGCLAGKGALGTAVDFARNPTEACRSAVKERKLVLLLHVSGNFEEARFT